MVPRARRLLQLLRDEAGSAAVETGLMLVPLLILTLTIFEVFLTLMTEQFLVQGTQAAGHEIAMTGTLTADAVRAKVCEGGMPFYSEQSCLNDLKVGIVPVTSGTPIPDALTAGGQLNSAAFTVSGSSSDILLVRTALEASGSSFPLSLASERWLVAGAITRVSPFNAASAGGK